MKYVTIYTRGKGLWLKYLDPASGEYKYKSSGYLAADPQGRSKCYKEAQRLSAIACEWGPVARDSGWDTWVPKFLKDTYDKPNKQKTYKRYAGAWVKLRAWLHERELPAPRSIEFKHLQNWIDYRTAQKKHSGKNVSRNTALCDLRLLGIVLRQALRLDYVTKVVTDKSGFKRDPAKEKLPISDEHVRLIRRELISRQKPQWMSDSFEIAIYQGCRLTETAVPLGDVSETARIVTFDAKGENIFATRLHDALIPLVKAKRAAKAKVLAALPAMAAKEWHTFLTLELKLPYCFHCTRVTVITRLAQAGVSISKAMSYVGHASEEIHRIYQKLRPSDLADATAALTPGGPHLDQAVAAVGDHNSAGPRENAGGRPSKRKTGPAS